MQRAFSTQRRGVAGVRNWLAPLDDLYTEEEKADILEAAYAAGSYNGSMIAAPQFTSTQLLFINKSLFDQAGIPVPGPDDRLTYEQIAELAQRLTQDSDGDGITDIWGFTWEQTVRIYQLQAMQESLGGQAISDDGLTVEGVINAQPWVDAYTYYAKAFNEWGFAPPSDVDAPELFAQGKLAMMIAGPWQIQRYSMMNDSAGPGFEWTVSRHPYFEGGEIAFGRAIANTLVLSVGTVLIGLLYTLMRDWGWINTWHGIFIPSLANGLVIFMFRQFFADIPQEILDAARVDGASWLRILFQITVPISLPAMISGSLILFLGSWNSFFWPLVVAPAPALRVVQVAVSLAVESRQTIWNELMAGAILAAIVPILLIFPFQRYYVRSIASTGIK